MGRPARRGRLFTPAEGAPGKQASDGEVLNPPPAKRRRVNRCCGPEKKKGETLKIPDEGGGDKQATKWVEDAANTRSTITSTTGGA